MTDLPRKSSRYHPKLSLPAITAYPAQVLGNTRLSWT
jgi:hypothetical protein